MICGAEHIEQPYSGEYVEKIYDIKNSFKSDNWTWIKFVDETGEWCGEFRGTYRGVSVSKKLGIVVVLTSDYMYVLDMETTNVIEHYSTCVQPMYTEITNSPYGDIFISDGYGIEMFTNSKVAGLKTIDMPIRPDNLKFVEWNDNILKISCYEFLCWDEQIELYFDCDLMEWIDNFKR